MSQSARRVATLTAELDGVRRERDRALAEVERLQAEVVRLHAKVQALADAEAARPPSTPPRLRGLASLLDPQAVEAHGA